MVTYIPVDQEPEVPTVPSLEPKRQRLRPIDDAIVHDEPFHLRIGDNMQDWDWYPDRIRSWICEEQVPPPLTSDIPSSSYSSSRVLPPLRYPLEQVLAAFVAKVDRDIGNMREAEGEITRAQVNVQHLNLEAVGARIDDLEGQVEAANAAEIMSRRRGGRNGGRGSNNNQQVCTYKTFMDCKPHTFSGAEGTVGLLRCMEKSESVFAMCNFPLNSQVKYESGTLEGPTLTWWNQQVQILTLEMENSLPWEEFKNMLKEEYCPLDEVQKLEVELSNLKIEGYEIEAYTTRSHELATLCPQMVTPTYKRIEMYIGGLVPQIQSMVTSSNPTTVDQTIRLAHKLTDQAVAQGTLHPRKSASKVVDNKRKFDSPHFKSSQFNPPARQQHRKFEHTKNTSQSNSAQKNQGTYAGDGMRILCVDGIKRKVLEQVEMQVTGIGTKKRRSEKGLAVTYGQATVTYGGLCLLYDLVRLMTKPSSRNYLGVLVVQVGMDRNYIDDQYYYEPCSNCGITGHWAQDCPRYNSHGGGPEYQSYQENYNQDYHPSGPPEQDNYQSELDVIRSDMKEMTKVVEAVVQQQESQAKAHQALIDLVSHLTGIVASIIKEVGKPCSAHQFSSSQTTNSAHLNDVSLQPSSDLSDVEHTPPLVVERVVEYNESESDPNQEFISQNNLKTENVNEPVKIPFPDALIKPFLKEKDPTQDERWEKFEKRKINSLFLNTLKQDPDNVECLKGLSTRKRRHKCPEQVKLSVSVNAVFTGTLPPKLQDPGAPIISIQIGEITLNRALLDLGASVSIIPGSLYDQHEFGPLQRVNSTVVLADQTPAHPRGIVKDVIVKVGELYYSVDFLVLDCVKNIEPTIILGRPFLATAQANINCAEGTVRMRFGAQKMSLKIFSNLQNPKANKGGSSEKVNHIVENACVVFDRSAEMKNGETPDNGKKRVRKRKRKGKKPRVHDVDQELFSLFMKAWRKLDDERNLSVGKEDCKHPTRPP
ncbi:hypothetical protein L1987_40623 [Smallanthus sonchifolius]|uniref:Uncharacterized protein n=1 Tax=Smallanthus sonchifolius TaxID=185202 RepID=A0ACB9GUG2_9ASTR|nr:hypothetical protein L1987_40623 [Smallanthus sonchifolius]